MFARVKKKLGAQNSLDIQHGFDPSTATFTSSATWKNTDFNLLGLKAGTYEWTWGSGGNADDIKVMVPATSGVPEPGSLALAVCGVVTLVGYRWRRRQRTA